MKRKGFIDQEMKYGYHSVAINDITDTGCRMPDAFSLKPETCGLLKLTTSPPHHLTSSPVFFRA